MGCEVQMHLREMVKLALVRRLESVLERIIGLETERRRELQILPPSSADPTTGPYEYRCWKLTSTTAPRYFAPFGIVRVGVVSLSMTALPEYGG